VVLFDAVIQILLLLIKELKGKYYSFFPSCVLCIRIIDKLGYVVAQLVEALCYKLEGHKFDSWEFLIFQPPYGPGDDSASNRNKYQVYLLGLKVAGAQGFMC